MDTTLVELTYRDQPAADTETALTVLEDLSQYHLATLDPVDPERGVWRIDLHSDDIDLLRRHTWLTGGDDGESQMRLAHVSNPAVIAVLDRETGQAARSAVGDSAWHGGA